MSTNSVALAKISFQKLHPNESCSRKHEGGWLNPPGMERVKNGELVSLALKVMHKKNNIVTDGSVTNLVLHVHVCMLPKLWKTKSGSRMQ